MAIEAKVNLKVKKDGNLESDRKKAIEASKNIAKNTTKIEKSSDTISTNLKSAFNTAAVIGWAKIIKDTFNSMMKITEAQSTYIENLNMMKVAFGDTAQSAVNYVEKISSAVGFDQSGITKQLGIFRQISSAMGYTSEVADLLSTNMSKMSLDISSLYNVSAERAGKALESAMTGQVRSIRSLTGADITQATLQQYAYALGVEKSVTEMTRAEKTILIYLSLEKQLANANGDLARTVNSVSNQTKIFKDQILMAGRQIGGFFIPILKELLPILNGILMVFNTLTSMLMSFFGIDANSFANEFGIASSGLDEIEEGLNGVSQASKAAKNSLRGFDKLNNITTPTSSGGSSGVGGIGFVDNNLLAALDEYNLQLDKMKNKATDIRDKIMEWLGFTKQVNEKTGNITWKYKGANKQLDSFFKTTKKIYEFTVKIIKTLSGTFIDKISPVIDTIYTNIQTTLTNIGDFWNTFWEDVGNSIDVWGEPIIEGINTLFGTILDVIIIPYITQISEIWADLTTTLSTIWEEFGGDITDKIGQAINTIISLFQKIYDDIISPILTPFFEEIKWLWEKYINPLINEAAKFVAKLIGFTLDIYNYVIAPIVRFVVDILSPAWSAGWKFIIGTVSTAISFISKQFEHLFGFLNGVIDFITGVFSGNWEQAWTGVKNIFKNIIDGLANIFIIPINLIIDGINAFIAGLNKIKIPDWVPAVGGKGFHITELKKIDLKAEGGFVKSGEMYIARENGLSEYVGSFGNQTAVANNDQIVEGITTGVARGMAAANKESKVEIIATGDASGLLDFITFEQKKKNRQYGLG